jgi:hypothetical protein
MAHDAYVEVYGSDEPSPKAIREKSKDKWHHRRIYTACHINVPKKGWRHKCCRKKNVPQSERFFDNHYKPQPQNWKTKCTYQKTKIRAIFDLYPMLSQSWNQAIAVVKICLYCNIQIIKNFRIILPKCPPNRVYIPKY